MVFGSCCFLSNGRLNEMNAKSVTIVGTQCGLIFKFEVVQTFVHNEQGPQEICYVFPNDLKICIYETTFIVGDEIIKPKLKAKEEARQIYQEAISNGQTAIYGSNIGNGMTEFKLGNLMPMTECKVILQIAFTAQQTDERIFYIKFPIDVYTPSGSQGCLDSKFSHFSFKIQCDSEKVKKVTSNVRNYKFDNKSKFFEIINKIEHKNNQNSIIVNFETYEQINSSALISSNNDSKYDCYSITISPTIQPSNDLNNEFIFLIDCSGSMCGQSIENARKCLKTFIENLPSNSLFNVIRFGTYYIKLFERSRYLNSDTKRQALRLASNLQADLSGTEIYKPLSSIFSQPVLNGQRQIFLITDGEVNNASEIIDLARNNSKDNRIFSIGIGRGCDAGLIEGIANATGGKSDFVQIGDSISEKLLPQLKSSIYPLINSIEVHLSGESNDDFEVSPYPIQNISPNSSTVIFLRTKKNEKSNLINNDGILITAKYGNKSIEIPISEIKLCQNKDDSIGNSFLPLFAFNILKYYEHSMKLNDDEKKKAVELSISSGVLCKYTGFVGVSKDYANITDRYQKLRNMQRNCLSLSLERGESLSRLNNCDAFDRYHASINIKSDKCFSREAYPVNRVSKRFISKLILMLCLIVALVLIYLIFKK